MLLIPMASHAKSWFSLICACFPSPFVSDVFVIIKNHHLQLEVLTLRLSLVF